MLKETNTVGVICCVAIKDMYRMFLKLQLGGKDRKVSMLSDKKITEACTDGNDVSRCNLGVHRPYHMHCDAMFAVFVTVGTYLYLYQRIPGLVKIFTAV